MEIRRDKFMDNLIELKDEQKKAYIRPQIIVEFELEATAGTSTIESAPFDPNNIINPWSLP